jgi:hypothetical protein
MGLKSCPRNFPLASVARGSGVWAIRGREFPTAKIQAVTRVNPEIASFLKSGEADPLVRRGRPAGVGTLDNGSGPCLLPGQSGHVSADERPSAGDPMS